MWGFDARRDACRRTDGAMLAMIRIWGLSMMEEKVQSLGCGTGGAIGFVAILHCGVAEVSFLIG